MGELERLVYDTLSLLIISYLSITLYRREDKPRRPEKPTIPYREREVLPKRVPLEAWESAVSMQLVVHLVCVP